MCVLIAVAAAPLFPSEIASPPKTQVGPAAVSACGGPAFRALFARTLAAPDQQKPYPLCLGHQKASICGVGSLQVRTFRCAEVHQQPTLVRKRRMLPPEARAGLAEPGSLLVQKVGVVCFHFHQKVI